MSREKIEFSPTQLQEMVSLYKGGSRIEDLASRFDVSSGTIRARLIDNGAIQPKKHKKRPATIINKPPETVYVQFPPLAKNDLVPLLKEIKKAEATLDKASDVDEDLAALAIKNVDNKWNELLAVVNRQDKAVAQAPVPEPEPEIKRTSDVVVTNNKVDTSRIPTGTCSCGEPTFNNFEECYKCTHDQCACGRGKHIKAEVCKSCAYDACPECGSIMQRGFERCIDCERGTSHQCADCDKSIPAKYERCQPCNAKLLQSHFAGKAR